MNDIDFNSEASDDNPSLPVLDKSAAMETAGGDMELVELLRSTCLTEAINLIAQARQAVSEADWKTARRSGHSLRSSFGAIGAMAAQEKSAQLEAVAQDDPDVFESAIATVENALQQLNDHVNS